MVREPCCEVFRGINGKFYFRFVSANNRVLAYSRGYRDCKTALRRAREYARERFGGSFKICPKGHKEVDYNADKS